jgi:MarR family transcriptional regulator for hemolysin
MEKLDNLSGNYPLAMAVHELARGMRRAFDRRARALGFTQSQWRVLWAISKSEGASQAALAESLEMQPIAFARILDRMEHAGLVERRPDPTDRRAMKLYLTPQAGPTIQVLRGIADEMLGVASIGISEEQRDQVMAVLRAMRSNLERDNAPAQRTEAG